MPKHVEATKPRRLDRRNPFEWYTRRYGYFSAFLAGGGTTTRDKMIEGCMKTRTACGITTDTPAAVKKDVADHVYEWKKGAAGTGYKLTVKENKDGSVTCTHVDGVKWAKYMEGKAR